MIIVQTKIPYRAKSIRYIKENEATIIKFLKEVLLNKKINIDYLHIEENRNIMVNYKDEDLLISSIKPSGIEGVVNSIDLNYIEKGNEYRFHKPIMDNSVIRIIDNRIIVEGPCKEEDGYLIMTRIVITIKEDTSDDTIQRI